MKYLVFLNLILLFAFIGCNKSSESKDIVDDSEDSEVAKFTATTSTNKIYGVNTPIDFKLSFPRNVTVTGAPKLTLTIGNQSRSASYISGNNSRTLLFRYTTVAGDYDVDGITLSSEIDLNGGNLTFNDGIACDTEILTPNLSTVYVDTIAPLITSVTGPSAGAYSTGQALTFTFSFSETVYLSGSPRIELTIGGQTRYATYYSGIGTTTLKFRYVVSATDHDTDGIESSALTLNGGKITDIANNNLNLSHSTIDTSSVVIPNLVV